ncbi:hypothetical protein AAG906_006901 [Vitis piasezkii]
MRWQIAVFIGSLETLRNKKEKCQTGQLWTLYSEEDRMPKNYAQVKKIEPTPSFKLHVVFLEACSPPEDMVQPACYGACEFKDGKTKFFPRTDFSHKIRAESLGKNKFAILPTKGQVWALYKNLENDLMHESIHPTLIFKITGLTTY